MTTTSETTGWKLPSLVGRVLAPVLDRTIVFSFDRTGYLVHRSQFRDEDLDVDMQGKVCLVTGANAGLGYETARSLARRGAEVWLLCRNVKRGTAALTALRRDTRNPHLHLEQIDLASLTSVRAFAKRLARQQVDVLVNNAGVLLGERSVSADGIELTLATNVIGPFLLTHLLLPRLKAAGKARVITVSSGGMYTQKLDLRDPQMKKRAFDGVVQYALTKRAEVILTELWADRLRGSGITFNSMHPGWADTPGVQSSLPRFYGLMRPLLRTPAEGADTIVWLAVCPRIARKTGLFWFDRAPQPTHFLSRTREAHADRERLWDLCRRLSGIRA